jgi:hypothetical protein
MKYVLPPTLGVITYSATSKLTVIYTVKETTSTKKEINESGRSFAYQLRRKYIKRRRVAKGQPTGGGGGSHIQIAPAGAPQHNPRIKEREFPRLKLVFKASW